MQADNKQRNVQCQVDVSAMEKSLGRVREKSAEADGGEGCYDYRVVGKESSMVTTEQRLEVAECCRQRAQLCKEGVMG